MTSKPIKPVPPLPSILAAWASDNLPPPPTGRHPKAADIELAISDPEGAALWLIRETDRANRQAAAEQIAQQQQKQAVEAGFQPWEFYRLAEADLAAEARMQKAVAQEIDRANRIVEAWSAPIGAGAVN